MKRKQRIVLFGMVATVLIFVACGGDSGNNSSETERNSSSSIEFSSSSGQISLSSVVESSSSLLVTESSSSVVEFSSSSLGILSSSSIEYGTLIYGGQVYKTVKIGTQTWMAENLNYAVDSSWCYNNSADSCTKYGRLYQWAGAMNVDTVYNSTTWGGSDVNHQGICPEDWHLPSTDEWQTLYDYVDANNGDEGVGTSLKSSNGWHDSAEATGTDAFGFSALSAGARNYNGGFYETAIRAYFWSVTESHVGYAYNWGMYYVSDDFDNYSTYKDYGFSVRCLKN